MKYRWYIVDLDDGDLQGTNDQDTADSFAVADSFVVIDTEFGALYTINEDGMISRTPV